MYDTIPYWRLTHPQTKRVVLPPPLLRNRSRVPETSTWPYKKKNSNNKTLFVSAETSVICVCTAVGIRQSSLYTWPSDLVKSNTALETYILLLCMDISNVKLITIKRRRMCLRVKYSSLWHLHFDNSWIEINHLGWWWWWWWFPEKYRKTTRSEKSI